MIRVPSSVNADILSTTTESVTSPERLSLAVTPVSRSSFVAVTDTVSSSLSQVTTGGVLSWICFEYVRNATKAPVEISRSMTLKILNFFIYINLPFCEKYRWMDKSYSQKYSLPDKQSFCCLPEREHIWNSYISLLNTKFRGSITHSALSDSSPNNRIILGFYLL